MGEEKKETSEKKCQGRAPMKIILENLFWAKRWV